MSSIDNHLEALIMQLWTSGGVWIRLAVCHWRTWINKTCPKVRQRLMASGKI